MKFPFDGFPVPAGIDPARGQSRAIRPWLPRARGDRPPYWRHPLVKAEASPCPRGSTRSSAGSRPDRGGFPVPAGIDPPSLAGVDGRRGLPRARGDRPLDLVHMGFRLEASPCPRGSTWPGSRHGLSGAGFPVPAGIDQVTRISPTTWRGLPRARGDRPLEILRPLRHVAASPCPRGSTPRTGSTQEGEKGFPVPAGIDPPRQGEKPGNRGLPRARGDRPEGSFHGLSAPPASPCPRGSTWRGRG